MDKRALIVLLLLFVSFLATSSLQLDNHMHFPIQVDDKSDGGPCCNDCYCIGSRPPQCRCTDVKSYCKVTCRNCACTKTIPPKCHCFDVKNHCDNPCSPPPAAAPVAAATNK